MIVVVDSGLEKTPRWVFDVAGSVNAMVITKEQGEDAYAKQRLRGPSLSAYVRLQKEAERSAELVVGDSLVWLQETFSPVALILDADAYLHSKRFPARERGAIADRVVRNSQLLAARLEIPAKYRLIARGLKSADRDEKARSLLRRLQSDFRERH